MKVELSAKLIKITQKRQGSCSKFQKIPILTNFSANLDVVGLFYFQNDRNSDYITQVSFRVSAQHPSLSTP